jgi:hypothetical protein
LAQLLEAHRSQLAAPHVSAAFNALANMTQAHPRTLEPLLQQHLLPALDSLMQAADTAEKAAAAQQSSTDSRSQLAQQQRQLDSQSCAVILQSMARLQECSGLSTPSSIAHELLLQFLQPCLLQQAIPQGIAMVATAAAKLHVPARNYHLEQLLAKLLELAADSLAVRSSRVLQLNPMHVSQTLWGVATMLAAQKRAPPANELLQLFQEVAALLTHPQLQLLQEAKPVEICNTLSAFVIAELSASSLPSPKFAAELLGSLAALRNLRKASARDMSRTLWAAAKLGAEVEAVDCKAIVAMFCSSEVLHNARAQVGAQLVGCACAKCLVCRKQQLHAVKDARQQQTLWQTAHSITCVLQTVSCAHYNSLIRLQVVSAGMNLWLCTACDVCTLQDVANLMWALGILQQHEAVTSHELCMLAAALLEQAQAKRAAPEEISTTLWGLATLQARLPRQLLVQIQEQFRQPHILQEIAADDTESLGLINTLWAAAALQKAELAGASKSWRVLQLQQQQLGAATAPQLQQPVLPPAAVQQLTDMLTAPGRLSHLTPCSVGLCLWSTAVLGGSLTFDQVHALVRRFLQPSCQALALPLNFTNTVWGCIRLGRVDVLQEPGVLQQLVAAYFKAGAPGGSWSGSNDPMAASMLLWAIARASKSGRSHCTRPASSRRFGSIGKQQLQLEQQDAMVQEQQQEWQRDGEGSSRDAGADLVPQKQVQQLFGIFMQRSSLKQADCISMSTAMYAAAAMRLPIDPDDLSWVVRAYMARLDEAGATASALMMYAITQLQRSALQQGSCSRLAAAAGGSWGAQCFDAADADSLVQVLVQLTQVRCLQHAGAVANSMCVAYGIWSERTRFTDRQCRHCILAHIACCIVSHTAALYSSDNVAPATAAAAAAVLQEISWRLQFDAESDDILTCVLSLTRAFYAVAEVPGNCDYAQRHQEQLQQALHGLLRQLLQSGSLPKLTAVALLDVVWACGEMAVAEPKFLAAVCRELQLLGMQEQQQRSSLGAAAAAVPEKEISLRPSAPSRPRHLLIRQQQQQRQHEAPSVQLQKLRDRQWQLNPAGCSHLLAALASLNCLTDEFWQAAVQPYLLAAAAAADKVSTAAAQAAAVDTTTSNQAALLSTGEAADATAEQQRLHHDWVPLMCWAAAVGDCCSRRSAVLRLVKGLVTGGANSWSHVTLVGRCQLYQVHLWLQDSAAAEAATKSTAAHAGEAAPTAAAAATCAVTSAGLAAVLSPEQLEQCRQDWCGQAAVAHPSAQQSQVAAALRRVPGVSDVKLEMLSEDGCFSVDIAAVVNQQQLLQAAAGGEAGSAADSTQGALAECGVKPATAADKAANGSVDGMQHDRQQQQHLLAVEVDGPQHFVYPAQQLNGESRLRSKALQARGYVVVRVPWFEWEGLQSSAAEQQQQQQQQHMRKATLVAGGDIADCLASFELVEQRQVEVDYLVGKIAAALRCQ